MLRRVLFGLWLPVALLAAWELAAHAGGLNPLFFPPPSALLLAAAALVSDGELAGHLRATLSRLALGFSGGAAAGLLCGVLMGGFAAVRHSLEPLVSAVYSTPKLTLLPMLMLFLGVGETARILLIATGAFTMVAMHGLDAVRRLDRSYVEQAANYGARGWTLFRKVYFPASLPHVFTGLRLALGRGLVITIAVELVSSHDGLGGMIWMAWQTFSTERLFVGVLTSAMLGLLFHNGLRRLESQLIPWRSQY